MGMIWCVCKDPGGTNGVLPVAKKLTEMGHTSIIIPNGKALELLPNMGIEFFTLDKALEVAPLPDVVVTSMCSEGGVGRNLVPLMRLARIPVVALQDYWGTRLVDSWQNAAYRPDYICVNDEICAELVMKAWTDFRTTGIKITGFPMLDKYAAKNGDKTEARKKVAEKLGLDKDWPIIALPVGIFHGASGTLREVGQALRQTGRLTYFVPRYHPRMAENAPEEVNLWIKALGSCNRNGLVIDSSACKTPEILEAADLVISEYSTSLLEASVLGKPTISIFYMPAAQELFHKEFGDLMDEPPFVTLGLTYSARNTDDLAELISLALDKGPRNLKAQEDFIRNHVDGKNAERVAEFVSSLI
ncbi:MAG: CDP-glycerol glycerophosphotransferase family protein [Candidatus Yanofskybacteria bacterium]|nr:CDP-glycerol glycerophosphotransferase family protein [Candidatus Yanofskybacteria bacterium]